MRELLALKLDFWLANERPRLWPRQTVAPAGFASEEVEGQSLHPEISGQEMNPYLRGKGCSQIAGEQPYLKAGITFRTLRRHIGGLGG